MAFRRPLPRATCRRSSQEATYKHIAEVCNSPPTALLTVVTTSRNPQVASSTSRATSLPACLIPVHLQKVSYSCLSFPRAHVPRALLHTPFHIKNGNNLPTPFPSWGRRSVGASLKFIPSSCFSNRSFVPPTLRLRCRTF